ncbi:hypothetical protein ACQ4LE_007205 [Meloidogyne hapla]|uniref:Uncharacterized protein n=1 Tax=Meloidogyne hapla TaxID=6305 RepID=A0A1I8AZY8_MELHA
MNEAALECEEPKNLKDEEPATSTSKMSSNLNRSNDSINNYNLEEEREEENNQNGGDEEDDDDDFGDFEEAPQTAFRIEDEKEDKLDAQDASKEENCQTSSQPPTTSSTTKQTTYLTIADILEQPELFKTLKTNQNQKEDNLILIKNSVPNDSIFDDLFKQMDDIDGINLLEREKEVEEIEDDEEKKLRHSIAFRSLNFWNQICHIEEAKALKFRFADSFTFKEMVEILRLNFCD